MSQASVVETKPAPLGALAVRVMLYSLLLSVIFQASHIVVQYVVAQIFGVSLAAVDLDVSKLASQAALKTSYSVFICEAVIFASILARRYWLIFILLAGAGTLVGVFIGNWLQTLVENLFTSSSFNSQVALQSSFLRSAKYSALSAGLAWAERRTIPQLRHFVLAGFVGALGSLVVTLMTNGAATPSAIARIPAFEIVFPIGCSLVVWKVKQITEPLMRAHQEAKTRLKNI